MGHVPSGLPRACLTRPQDLPSPWASGPAVAPGSHHHGAMDASSPAAWSPGGRGNGQPGPLLGPVAAPSTRGPPRARQHPESGAAPGLFCGEDRRLGKGREGHVPRVTQLLNGRAERQTGSPELLAAASTSASPQALHPRAQPPFSAPSRPPQVPPTCPAGHACECCRAPSLPEHSDSCEQSPSHPSRAAPACPILPTGWAGQPHGGRTDQHPCPPVPGSASPASPFSRAVAEAAAATVTGTGLGAPSWDSSSARGTPEAGTSWCRLVRGHAGPGDFQSPVDPAFSWRKSVNMETSRGGAPESSAKTVATNCKLTRGLGGKTGQRVDGVTARPLQSWVSGGSLTPPAVAPPPSLAISWRRRVSDLGFASHQMATEANRLTTVHLHVYMLTGHLLHFRDLNLQITKALPR